MGCENTRALADGALDALALVEASVEDNPTNRDAVLRHADLTLLIGGLVVLASTMRQTIATLLAIPAEDVDRFLRHKLIAVGDEASR